MMMMMIMMILLLPLVLSECCGQLARGLGPQCLGQPLRQGGRVGGVGAAGQHRVHALVPPHQHVAAQHAQAHLAAQREGGWVGG